MLAIAFQSLTGRWHATPWGHHVNEGLVEWPPSPWRLMRALIATWHHKASHDITQPELQNLLDQLSDTLPVFALPPAVIAHSRHYMPLFKDKTTKIIDAFAHLPQHARIFCWWPDLTLSPQDRNYLDLLLQRMTYLGRAESWFEARLLSDQEIENTRPNAIPLSCDPVTKSGSAQQEIVRLLAPMRSSDYTLWRNDWLSSQHTQLLQQEQSKMANQGKDPEKAKLSKAQKDKLEQAAPTDLLAAMTTDHADLQKQGWSQPPGSQWVEYVRPRDAFAFSAEHRFPQTSQDYPTVARFAVSSAVLPRLPDVLPFAEKIRKALLSRSDGHPAFVGRDSEGLPNQGHSHTYILPEANRVMGQTHGAPGAISFLSLYCPQGFDPSARACLDNLRKVWGHGGHDVFFILLGLGYPQDFAGFNHTAGQCSLFATSTVWESRTPFVPTRHPKTRNNGTPKLDETGLAIGSPEHDLRRLLREHGCPDILSVEKIEGTDLDGHFTRWPEFRILRKDGDGRRSTNRGFGFRIQFAQPWTGPLAVGYGAHFGLGLFEPVGSFSK